MKKTLSMILAVVLLCGSLLTLTSCDAITSLLPFGEKETEGPAEPETVWVYFDPNGGEFEDEDDEERECTIGEKIGTLPKVERDGYKFLGWFDEDENKYKKSTIVEDELDLIAEWEKIVESTQAPTEAPECPITNSRHIYSYSSTDATCTEPGRQIQTCVCGKTIREIDESAPALGHNWTEWEDVVMASTRTCKRCSEVENAKFINVTSSAQNVKMDGDVYSDGVGAMINGQWDDQHIAGKGSSPITFTMYFNEDTGVYVDYFYMLGSGSASYIVKALYLDGDDYVQIGSGAFGSEKSMEAAQTFNVGGKVTEIVVYMANCSNGMDYWRECAVVVRPENKDK